MSTFSHSLENPHSYRQGAMNIQIALTSKHSLPISGVSWLFFQFSGVWNILRVSLYEVWAFHKRLQRKWFLFDDNLSLIEFSRQSEFWPVWGKAKRWFVKSASCRWRPFGISDLWQNLEGEFFEEWQPFWTEHEKKKLFNLNKEQSIKPDIWILLWPWSFIVVGRITQRPVCPQNAFSNVKNQSHFQTQAGSVRKYIVAVLIWTRCQTFVLCRSASNTDLFRLYPDSFRWCLLFGSRNSNMACCIIIPAFKLYIALLEHILGIFQFSKRESSCRLFSLKRQCVLWK